MTRPAPRLPAFSLAVALVLGLVATALFAGAARAETVSVGNGIYTVDVNNEDGEYTVTTGPSHPLGEGLNVLFGDGTPGTSFDSIHSYTSGVDYELPSISSRSTVALGTTGFQTTYSLSRPEQEDDLGVVQTVRADGYRPAQVTVAYALSGAKDKLTLGSASAEFKKAGVYRLSEHLSPAEMAKLRGAKSFSVRFAIPKTPKSCGRYYTKRLTIPRKVSGQTVWFQSDSRFAPGG